MSENADVPREQPSGADLGVGSPAEDVGDGDGPATPPGYPDEVDPAEGPVGSGDRVGSLDDPGAPAG
ncbi:hypothetical protein GTR02_17450 [Kineococcus sp. R8]|uniref:hypothetical protein n=1 Tax=Kineococcus siccus TaxID=2696567 RepID=UPI0014121D03|nr:hypothetical protein [Kineococcus siccus]NAZ83601.1 hypothetical protein [Kineococcus siccus]